MLVPTEYTAVAGGASCGCVVGFLLRWNETERAVEALGATT